MVAEVLLLGFWAKAMALPIALSVIGTTGTDILLSADPLPHGQLPMLPELLKVWSA